MILPGATLGILGGGQLGRMLAVAAAKLGYRCHIYAPEKDCVASHVANDVTQAAWDDEERLAAFARKCSVVTLETENIPLTAIRFLSRYVAVHPGEAALSVAQDRLAEKNFVGRHGGRTARFAGVLGQSELDAALTAIGAPAILKTLHMGYDGKGQAQIPRATKAAALAAWDAIGRAPAIYERLIAFTAEFSVVAVRGIDGEIRFWDSPHNVHEKGILVTSALPPPAIIAEAQGEARSLTAKIAASLDYVGVLACEFFVSAPTQGPEQEPQQLGPIFNEMAPRVHNSGHWTIEGAVTSQFENHIRALCGLPLGDTSAVATPVLMRNLIGKEIDTLPSLLADSGCHVHHYGKAEVRTGRKLGHATWVGHGA